MPPMRLRPSVRAFASESAGRGQPEVFDEQEVSHELADIRTAIGHVRFTPISGHVRCKRACLLWANSGYSPIHSITSLASPALPIAKHFYLVVPPQTRKD